MWDLMVLSTHQWGPPATSTLLNKDAYLATELVGEQIADVDQQYAPDIIVSRFGVTPIMHLLQCLYYYVALFNIHFRAEHIPGLHNVVAESLSRNILQVFSARLEAIAHQLMHDNLAPSFQQAYSLALLAFVKFCHNLQVPALPAHE